jgi:hypothetical protein
MLEAGDIVLLQDNGDLKIPNFVTGIRNIGEQLFEVIDRTINIVTGNVKLTLLSGIADTRTDRYGAISPSSSLITDSTTTILNLKDANESAKWAIHIGGSLYLHARKFDGYDETCILTGVNVGNLAQLIITGLTSAPPVNTVLDIAPYPTSTDKAESATFKNIYAFLSPTLHVVAGINGTSFTVSSGDAAKILPTAVLKIHNKDFTIASNELTVLSVVGTTITTNENIGFTPANGQLIDFVGFADGGGAYRLS